MPEPRPFVSSGAFGRRTLAETLAQAREWGVEALELSSGLAHSDDIPDLVRAAKREFRLLIHNYFPPPATPFVLNLASADAEIRARSIAHCRAALELSADVEAPFFAAHSGFLIDPKVKDLGRPIAIDHPQARTAAMAIFRDAVGELVEWGRKLGVRFLIENNVAAPFNLVDGRNAGFLMVEAEEIAAFAAQMDARWFGLLIDVGHVKVSALSLNFCPDAFIRTVNPWLVAWHLSDNDGTRDANLPFDQTAWFMKHLAAGTVRISTIEAYDVDRRQLDNCLAALAAGLRARSESS